MKKDEIVVGVEYENKNGQVRRIISAGDHCCGWNMQFDKDCVKFKVIKRSGPTNTRYRIGDIGFMTRRAFATWAMKRLD
jgi:hypothetical protein